MTTYEAPHITEARRTQEQALKYRCPFCRSDPGQLCRANRGQGRELDYSHSRRIARSEPSKDRRRPVQVQALCCTCGNLRTVSANYYASTQDPNGAYSEQGKVEGWRETKSLKCAACGERTRHAVLRADEDKFRDWDEERQRIALGDEDKSKYPYTGEYLQELRRKYRQLHPQNPYLRHRYYPSEAKTAWDEGHKKVTALCGAEVTIDFDPHQPKNWSQNEKKGHVVAKQLSDTEYEDAETGLWWLDMACVDCCRVSNRLHWDAERERLKWFLTHFALNTGAIPDLDVGELVEHLSKLYEQTKEPED
ncbi:DUF6315 family protein [Mycolicibacterium sp. Y3]